MRKQLSNMQQVRQRLHLTSKPAVTLVYRPERPVAPVFIALSATNFVASQREGALTEGAPLGGGRAVQHVAKPRSGEAHGRAGAHTT